MWPSSDMQNTVNNEGSFTESIFLMPKVYRGIFKETGDEFTERIQR